jgi:hypothetical protein
MIRPTPCSASALPLAFLLIASCWSAASFAQSAPAPETAEARPAPSEGDTRRLTDAERDAILSSNTVERAAAVRGELPDSEGPGRGIHGEVGVMSGTNGTRGAYGTADIPLGDNARATVAVESSTFGYRR